MIEHIFRRMMRLDAIIVWLMTVITIVCVIAYPEDYPNSMIYLGYAGLVLMVCIDYIRITWKMEN